jgi:putative SOS response-associated peptidase YedK
MCFYKGIKTNVNLNITLGETDLDLSGFEPLFKEVEVGFDFSPSVVVINENGTLQPRIMEWGFIPSYIRDGNELLRMRSGYTDSTGKFHPPMDLLNARVETVFQNLYKDAAQKRHCLVPATHFFEWRHLPKINKKTGKPLKTTDKYPYVIQVKQQEWFWMAGIWQGWTDRQTGEYLENYAIITQPANELMKKIHNSKERMPAILTNQQAYDFLNTSAEQETLAVLSDIFPSNKLQAHTIQKDFRMSSEPLLPVIYTMIEEAEKGTVENGKLF